MKQKIMSIFTRTPLHVGAGASVGAVDQPIIRERHTAFPVIPGSSMKGVLAALWSEELVLGDKEKLVRQQGSDPELLFGSDGDDKNIKAGKLLVGEGKILAFPVRSAKNAFAWCTCPLALARAKRDFGLNIPSFAAIGVDQCLAPAAMTLKDKVILEEYCLLKTGDIGEDLVTELQGIADDVAWQEELQNHLVILSDEMFSYFVENACEIAQHVKINAETGTAVSGGLFNQVNVPSESMFYAVMHEMRDGLTEKLAEKLAKQDHVLQIGADAGSGLGWCSVKLFDKLA